MKNIFLLFFLISYSSCVAQENLIVEKTKVNWVETDGLFQDATKTTFIEKFHFLENVDMYEITYLSDGLKIESYAAIPKNVEGKIPVIIYNRGGNRDFGALQLFKGRMKVPVAYLFSVLANEGFIVIGCNYRGSGKSEGNEEFGGKDVNDVLNLIEVVKEMPEADPSKIGMYGWSRGGMMTYIALTKTKEIKAAVVGGAPADLTIIDRPDMETMVYAQLMPDYENNKEAELKKRSAVYFADKFPKDVPILMLHGNADWRVKSTESLRLALEFEKHRIPYRLKIFEGAGHGIREFREEKDQEVVDWFTRFLKNDEALPSMAFPE